MVKIDFDEPTATDWRVWREACQTATQDLINSAEHGGGPSVAIRNLYKDNNIKNRYYFDPNAPFHGKCAYCEQPISGDQYGDIEHYRPAKKVTKINDEVVRITVSGEERPHPGYYWLAYEWRNLLFSCVQCNRPKNAGTKKIGKHNRFPTEDDYYAHIPGDEGRESPLLINPLIEDPEEHITVDIRTGVLAGKNDSARGKNDSARGKASIDILGLNDRALLLSERKEATTRIKAKLTQYLSTENDDEERKCLEYFCAVIAGHKPYSLIQRTFIKEKFGSFYSDLIEQKCIEQ